LTAIRHKLARMGEIARKRWDSEKMEDHMRTPEFKARVARLDSILPRGKQLGAVLLAVADAMEWSAEAERVIASYIAERREDTLEPEREVLAEIVSEHLAELSDGYVELKNAEVLKLAKQRLEERGLKPISKFRWLSMRDEFKIESRRRSSGLLLRFGPASFKALGIAWEESGLESPKAAWPPDIPPALDALGDSVLDAIEDRVKEIARWDPKRPDSWVAKDIMLRFQLPEPMRAELEARIPDIKERFT